MMNRVLCVSAFPERRNTISEECRSHGLDVTFIESPKGKEAAKLGFLAAPTWRDPYKNRLLTWGELACFAGHYSAWQRAAERKEGAVIIEDDAAILGPLEFSRLGEIVYLGGRFMGDQPLPAATVEESEAGLIPVPYTYWTVGYWISQYAARQLISDTVKQWIIPTDEFLPFHCGLNPHVLGRDSHSLHGQVRAHEPLSAHAVPKWLVEPSKRWPSSTENSEPAFDLRTAFFATDPAKAAVLERSLKDQGWYYSNLMAGDPGWDTSGPGGRQKLEALQSWVAGLDQTNARAIVLALDGYDTIVLAPPDEVLRRYAELGSQIVIGGEMACWPAKELKDDLLSYAAQGWPGETSAETAIYQFPCSGTIMGTARALNTELKSALGSADQDDQLLLQKQMLSQDDQKMWRVDREAYLFQSLNGADGHLDPRGEAPYNVRTKCWPKILHDNGPTKNLNQVIPAAKSPEFNIELAPDAGQWLTLAPDVLGMPFLKAETALAMAEAAQAAGPWQPLPGDNVPGDELRMSAWDEGLKRLLTGYLTSVLKPIVESVWRPARWREPKDLFFIRFSKNGQPQIRLHEDKSYLSCSIKLRGACSGGELWFPRQNFSDSLIAPGWLIIWPSEVTHPHRVLPVKQGKRVSLVVWT